MARDDKGLTGRLLEEGTRLVAKAAEKVLSDPRGQDAVARALEAAQKGRKRVEELQGRFMKAAGIPDRQDYQDLAKQLARIKRKAREIAEKLDGEPGGGEGDEGQPRGGGTRH